MISARFVKKSSTITCASIVEHVLKEIRANQNAFNVRQFDFEAIDYPSSKWVVIFGGFPIELEKLHSNSEFIDLYYFDECSPCLSYTHNSGNQCIRRINMSTPSFDKERIDISDGAAEDWEECLSNNTMHSAYNRIVEFFGLKHPYNQKSTEPRSKSISLKVIVPSVLQKAINALRYGSRVSVIQIQINDTTHLCSSKRINASSSVQAKYQFLFEGEFLAKELLESTYARSR